MNWNSIGRELDNALEAILDEMPKGEDSVFPVDFRRRIAPVVLSHILARKAASQGENA